MINSQANNKQPIRIDFRKIFLASATVQLPPLSPGEDIYDIRNFERIPYPWLEQLGKTAAGILALWLAARFLRWLLMPAEESPRKPHQVDHLKDALTAMDRLKKSPVWRNDHIKDICEQMTAIFKNFLKNRFELGLGCAATSDELNMDMTKKRVPEHLRKSAFDLMQICDGVKFAKCDLTAMTRDKIFDEIIDLLTSKDWQS